MAIVGQLIVLMGMNNAPLLAGIAQSSAAMKGMGATGATTGAMVNKALLGIGAVGAVGLIVAVKAAADFEDAMTGVRKTVDEADLAAAGMTFEGLGMQFRQMATQIPVAATELAAIGETAGALGINAGDIENFTRTVALLGSTTDLSTSQAAESLGKVGTILGLTGNEFEGFADILVNLGNKGASTESEIIEVTKRWAAAGMQAGLSTPQILAFSSAITSAGVEPEAAGSSLSRLFGNIVAGAANGTKAGQAFAKTTGMAFGDFSNLVKTDTVGAMLLVLDSLNDLDKFGQQQALASMGITAVRDVNAIRLLAATYDTNLIPALDNARNSQGALAIEAEKRFQSFNVQLELLGNNLTELAISAGTPLLPMLTAGVQALSGAMPGLASGILPVIAGMIALGLAVLAVNVAVGALGILMSPLAVIIAGIAGSAYAIQGFLDKNNALAAAGFDTPESRAAEKFNQGDDRYRTEAQKHGYMPGMNPQSGQPWGTFNTPGFHAGEVGSPFAGPMSPARAAFGGRSPDDRSMTVNQTTNLIVDGDKLATIVERRLYNDAGTWSSGFANPGPSPIR